MFTILTSQDSDKYGPFDAVVLSTTDYTAACRMLAQVRKTCSARMIWS